MNFNILEINKWYETEAGKINGNLVTCFINTIIKDKLDKNILYFKSPTDIKNDQAILYKKKIRVGGMVKKNTLEIKEQEIKFVITDFKNELLISYSGTVPNLFYEEKGVVAEGKLQDKSFFIADRILAKHDENYMPPELQSIMNNNDK